MSSSQEQEKKYFGIIKRSLKVCKTYRPHFGQTKGVTLEQFTAIYSNDQFYSWLGLGRPEVYEAHRIAGVITSLYRQIGIACQEIFVQIIRDKLGLSKEDSSWSVAEEKRTLDARIDCDHIRDENMKEKVKKWLAEAADFLEKQLKEEKASRLKNLKGAVFEVRQGYKSRDAKRQNADLVHASKAYESEYLPVLVLFSNQIDGVVNERYRRNGWLILYGNPSGTKLDSTYVFAKEVLDFDLADFFRRKQKSIRKLINDILKPATDDATHL